MKEQGLQRIILFVDGKCFVFYIKNSSVHLDQSGCVFWIITNSFRFNVTKKYECF